MFSDLKTEGVPPGDPSPFWCPRSFHRPPARPTWVLDVCCYLHLSVQGSTGVASLPQRTDPSTSQSTVQVLYRTLSPEAENSKINFVFTEHTGEARGFR